MKENIIKGQQSTKGESQNSLWQLAFCATGICVCYLYYGVLFEKLFHPGEHKLGAVFVLVTQSFTNALVAFGWKQLSAKNDIASTTTEEPLPHGFLFAATACYVGAMTCSNEAVRYVSYPVAVLAKSCKLIPTMLVGQFVQGKLYTLLEWTAALCISAGIVLFHLTRLEVTTEDGTSGPNASYGMILLVISLTLDGVLAACQTLLKKPRPNLRIPNAIDTMLWMNIYACVYLIPVAVLVGQWDITALISIWHKIALLNATVALGQIFIFLTLSRFSPIMCTTITTTRKFITILLSVWTFGHHFTFWQWASIGLVFSGLYLAIIMVQKGHTDHQKKD